VSMVRSVALLYFVAYIWPGYDWYHILIDCDFRLGLYQSSPLLSRSRRTCFANVPSVSILPLSPRRECPDFHVGLIKAGDRNEKGNTCVPDRPGQMESALYNQ
jgi:hypothetical protein